MSKRIPLYIVTGFLGSGKTTLIAAMLAGMREKRIGLVVNDFGPICIDSSLLGDESAGTRTNVPIIKELRNGQLFCGCLVASFLEAVVSFARSDIDALWVEASGLAKPSPLLDTIAEIDRRTGDYFDFRGMACVVDAARFLPLVSVLNAVEEQIEYASLVIVNKRDLVSDSELAQVVQAVRSINPACRIVTAAQGAIPQGIFDDGSAAAAIRPGDPAYDGWGKPGRPTAFALSGAMIIEEARLRSFLAQIAPESFRIKGFVETESGMKYVDCVGADTKISDPSPGAAPTGLVVISAVGNSLRSRAMSLWKSPEDRVV